MSLRPCLLAGCIAAISGCSSPFWAPRVFELPAFWVAGPERGEVGRPFVVRGEAPRVGIPRRAYAVLATESLKVHLMSEYYENPFSIGRPSIEEPRATISVEAPFIPPLPGTYSYFNGTGQTVVN